MLKHLIHDCTLEPESCRPARVPRCDGGVPRCFRPFVNSLEMTDAYHGTRLRRRGKGCAG